MGYVARVSGGGADIQVGSCNESIIAGIRVPGYESISARLVLGYKGISYRVRGISTGERGILIPGYEGICTRDTSVLAPGIDIILILNTRNVVHWAL